MTIIRKTLVRALLTLICFATVSGCQGCEFFAYFISGRTRTVQPEFAPGMEDKKLAIFVHAPRSVASDFPRLIDEVTATLIGEFRRNKDAKGIDDMMIVDPGTVRTYKSNHLDWSTSDRTKMGKAVEADFVLFVFIVDFGTMVEGSGMLLFRGNILADAKLYDVSLPSRKAKVWPKDSSQSGSFSEMEPPFGPTHNAEESTVRFAVINKFTKKLVRKFHKHKVNKDEECRPGPDNPR